MKLGFEESELSYFSGSQSARAWTEAWVSAWAYCPHCGNAKISSFLEFGDASRRYPTEGEGVTRTETERLADMSLSFLAATDENLGQTDYSVSGGQIPVQSQCPLAFGDGLVSVVREN